MHEKEVIHNNPNYIDFKATLNPEQLEAMLKIEGPVLVLAGAGTGKTRVLTSRIAYMIENGINPRNILAVTFTNKAAKEMAERVAMTTGGKSNGMWLGTFHSIAVRILRSHPALLGLRPGFIIIDSQDQQKILKQILIENNIDDKRWPPNKTATIINGWKDKGLTYDKATDNENTYLGKVGCKEIYKIYQQQLLNLNAVDFGDLLLYNLIILQNNPDILESYQRQFKYILVDEYQDTNLCQYLWLRLLAANHKNICCVGDDDQSIYGWRGAEVGNILKFERDFKNATVIRLERNYRSTGNILNAASTIIANNENRLGKTLWTEDTDGAPINVVELNDEREEAWFIANEIESLQQIHQHNLNEIAVLVRAGFQTRAFEERFIVSSIPYKVIGGLRFYERAEIKDIIAYLRLIHSSSDDLGFERIINVPKRGLGDASLKIIKQFAKENQLSMFDAAVSICDTSKNNQNNSLLKNKNLKELNDFVTLINRYKQIQPHETLVNFTHNLLTDSGYLALIKAEDTINNETRIDNIKELLQALVEFSDVGQFLEHISLVSETDSLNQDKMVTIMTMHAAKGLEFETVFLTGWEEGLFPSQRSISETGKKGLEEERRLAYVGITRAKKRAYITHALNRRIYNQMQFALPSRFIAELPKNSINFVNRISSFTTFHNHKEPASNPEKFSFSNKRPDDFTANSTPSSNKIGSSKIGSKFSVGERVFHQKFGYGNIVSISGNQLDIDFNKAGTKKIIDSFVDRLS